MENNGRGIFYGVIGVATLVVAIIGATFAYFSAAGTGNQFTATGANVGLTLTDDTTRLRTNLIPVSTDGAGEADAFAARANLAVSDKDFCKDNNGYTICSVYTYTVTNPNKAAEGAIDQTLYGSFNPSGFNFLDTAGLADQSPKNAAGETVSATPNYRIAIFKGTEVKNVTGEATNADDASDGTLVYNETVTSKTSVLSGAAITNIPTLTTVLEPEATETYTVVMWIEEADHDQSYDMGRSFAGTIGYATAGGGKLTGALVG